MVPEDDCYSIGKVAGLCNTPVKTLRYYDEIGLLKPRTAVRRAITAITARNK